jgi:hypothetical protein
MLAESLVGGLVGGLLRLAPEVLKVFDRKNERAHELAMANIEVTIAEKKIEAGLRAGEQQIDVATLDAMGEALRGQAEMAKAGGQWVSAISALVRPLVTYWFVVLYSAHKIAMMVLAHETQGLGWAQVFATTWGEQDWAIFSMIVVFWFVGRVHERAAPRG